MGKEILVAVIKDVAKLAGVSVGTVSKYLNTPELLREDKREAVEDAIQKLNYRPNLFARNLRVQDSKTIAVIAQEIRNPFHAALFNTIRKEAMKYNYSVVLYSINDVNGNIDTLFESLPLHYFSGLVLCYFHDMEQSIAFAKRHDKVPMVIMSNSDRYFNEYDSAKIIHADFTLGIEKICEYLISRGNKNIAYIGCKTKDTAHEPKLKGFLMTMEKYGLKPHSITRLEKEYTMETGYESAGQILKCDTLPDAILSDTDIMAVGALNCLRDHNIKVPDDLMLASCDNIEFARYCCPRLTTVNVPIEAMSIKAVELLVAQMEDKPHLSTGTSFELELIIRESTK
ncbi:LacI family transcriptional regulator [Clostridium sp. AF19-22AC]|jgi:DNA-binding LacI/PurR family transcriptional regulator|uniref:LacI family DNA-binding transcriptional regulator n=1 Tax=Clostridia TaxID=186801 RepID=UPI000E556D82|nr:MULTISPECIES: LacI family DNA-binding transcriptional regulator [Clostridia]RHR32318.1 LacI family transcriptional regulator [Clostridium sp. AF19-22AC]